MKFHEKYHQESTWHGKAMIMEIYHLAMSNSDDGWTIKHTARDFGVSTGLVSENLRLAVAIHKNESIMKCETRQEALKKLNGSRL